MRCLLCAVLALSILACGGESEQGGGGNGGPGPSGGGSPGGGSGGVPSGRPVMTAKLTLSKVPDGFGIASGTPEVGMERSGLLVRPNGHTWITVATTEDFKEMTAQIEANTYLSALANYELPLPWKAGTYELTAGKTNLGDGTNVFHLANGGTEKRNQTIARVPEGATITIEVKRASMKVTRMQSMGIASLEVNLHLVAKHPLQVYRSEKMGGGWNPKAEAVDELTATLEVEFRGKLSVPDQGQDWLK